MNLDDFGGACLRCGYALRGLPQPRCPECGRVFDPTDSSTYSAHAGIPPLAQKLLLPLGRWVRVAAYLAFALTLFAGSLPPTADGVHKLWQLSLLGAWLPVGSVIVGRGIVRWCICKHYGLPRSGHAQRRTHAARLFLIGALFFLLKIPLFARFWISYPFLQHYAYQQHQVVPYPNIDTRNRWLGLYRTKRISVEPNGVTIWLLDGGVLRYEPYEPEEPLSEGFWRFWHLGGNWYIGDFGRW